MMRSRSNTAFVWMGILVVLCILAVPSTARAGSISYSNLEITSPVLVFASSNDAAISNQVISGTLGAYTLSAHFCLTGFCPGDSASSDLLRLTGVTLSCSSEGGICDPIDIGFNADGATALGFTGLDTWLVGASFTGTAPSGGFVNICIADSSHICAENATGSQATSFTFNSLLSGAVNYSFAVNGTFSLVGDLHFDGLPNGTTVTIPNSLEIAELAAATPEPGAIVLVITGLAGLGLLKLRRARIYSNNR